MSRLNALRTGWLPYIENPDYPRCCQWYDEVIRDDLAQRLKRLTAQVVSHPTFTSQFTQIQFHNHIEPRWMSLKFTFDDALVDDVLCTPDCVNALTEGNVDPTQLLHDLRDVAHTLDAWTRSHVHFIHSLMEACREAYGLGMGSAIRLRQAEFPEDQVHLTVRGTPPKSDASRPGFSIQIEAGIYPAHYTCPDCSELVPDLPRHHSKSGVPICPHCANDLAPLQT